MRFAGSPEIYEALVDHFISDAVPGDAAEHLAAEVMIHGEEAETKIDKFFELFSLLQSKGFDEEAAQHLAVEMMEGREPEAKQNLRYANVYGTSSSDSGDLLSADQAA